MPVRFTPDDVRALAALANLELDAHEIDVLTRELTAFLAYAEQVQQVDTSGVPPTAYVAATRELDRADEVRPSLDRDAALGNAPDAASEAGFFRVPRVIG